MTTKSFEKNLSKTNSTILIKKSKLFWVKYDCGKPSTNLSINSKNLNERMIKVERNMHKIEQYSRRECIEIARILRFAQS